MSVIAINRRTMPRIHAPGTRIAAPSLTMLALVFSTVFTVLMADATLHSRAFFDAWGVHQVQRIDAAAPNAVFTSVNALTSSTGAIVMWSTTMVVLFVFRQWIAAMALAVMPIGGVINAGFGYMAQHERPTGEGFVRVAETNAASFPSGHVMGAVMLYGLIFVLAGRIPNPVLRLSVRGASLAVLSIVGFARLWEGAHWPTDVLGAYSLGGLLLVALVAVYFRAEKAWGGLPLVKAGEIPHDESRRHAHALTSVVIFDGDTVSKVYSPGLLPRMAYFIAFQAQFPYINNRVALEAAMERRNLAGLLTEYWYGEPTVARALGVTTVDGHLALTSEFVEGHEPADRKAAKQWLATLRSNFEAAGLPTWQIDPRQPRAVDNVLEVAPGRYRIVDLESGLVAPIASFRSWKRAFRRGLVPLFDDIHFDITQRYVFDEEPAMRRKLGDARFNELVATLERASVLQARWRASEPRLWGRFAGGFWTGWGYRRWSERSSRLTARGQEKANRVLNQSVTAWYEEGRITAEEATRLRGQVESSEMQAILPHMGAHGAISLVLRFPLGSIARGAWTAGALSVDTGRLLTRRISVEHWKRSWTMHSPLVIAISVIPGFGAFAYLASKPVRQNRLLVRAVVDRLMLRVPGGLYEKTRVRVLVARRATGAPAPDMGSTETYDDRLAA